MTILTEGPRKAAFMLTELEGFYARDEVTVTVPANTTFSAGTVLGKLSATGKFVRHDSSLETGAEDAAAVLFANHINDTASAVDVVATVVTRGCEVIGSKLIYEDGADDSAKSDTNEALAALGIIVR